MAIDWDAELLGPVMDVFGEGQATDPSTWPLYSPPGAGGVPFTVRGAVYDAQYQRVTQLADGATETAYHPVLGVRDAVFAAVGLAPKANGKVYVPSVDQLFAVIDVQPDGHGHSLLILIEAA